MTMRGRRGKPMAAGPSGAALAAALALLAAGPARADDTCTPLVDAFTKFVTTPSHAYLTSKGGARGARQGEMIRTGGALYVLVHGTWVKRPRDAAEEADELREKLGDRSATCTAA